ncbi:MAG: hypothetical protein IPN92_01000 [Chromatiaceae bacterium]|nr:hypothetical protein [Chromatiaceae bacterium]
MSDPYQQQQLQGIDELPTLPVGKLWRGRHLLKVACDLLGRHTQQGHRTQRLREAFAAADVPGAHRLR